MMHREFMRTITAEDRRALTAKNNLPALLRLTVLLILFIITSVSILSGVSGWLIFLPVQGFLLVSLFHLLHECIHNTPFNSVALNKFVGSVCGFLLFIPCEWFRYFHRDHHRFTQIKDKDPELATDKPRTRSQWILHLTGLPLYKSLAALHLRLAVKGKVEDFVPGNARSPVINQVRISSVVYALLLCTSIITGSTVLFWVWLLPLFIGQPFLRLYLLAEHTLCEHSDNMFENTRTVLTNPVIRWFTWNMPYHTEHHIYPAVPFHKLPVLHKRMQQFLVNKDTSYTEFNRQLYQTLK